MASPKPIPDGVEVFEVDSGDDRDDREVRTRRGPASRGGAGELGDRISVTSAEGGGVAPTGSVAGPSRGTPRAMYQGGPHLPPPEITVPYNVSHDYSRVMNTERLSTGYELLRQLEHGEADLCVVEEASLLGKRQTTIALDGMALLFVDMRLTLLVSASKWKDVLCNMCLGGAQFEAQDAGRLPRFVFTAPQVFLPGKGALKSAGLREGDLVTHINDQELNLQSLERLRSFWNMPSVR
ncbi:unnamed protein product [Choristocarpus tenellus]